MEHDDAGQPEDLKPVDNIGASDKNPEAKEITDTKHKEDENRDQGQSKSRNRTERLKRKARVEAEARAKAEAEADKLRETVSSLEKRMSAIENPPPERPRPVDFESDEAYEDALYNWRKDLESRDTGSATAEPAESKPQETEQRDEPQQSQASDEPPLGLTKEQYSSWEDRYEDALESHEDFEEVFHKQPEDGGPVITDVMAQTIMLDEQGAEIAYHLATNVEESEKIARLPFAQQVTAIKDLAAKFGKSATNAPDPINPEHGSDDTASVDLDDLSPEAYAAKRRRDGMGRS